MMKLFINKELLTLKTIKIKRDINEQKIKNNIKVSSEIKINTKE